MARSAADLEQRPGAVEVHAHAEIEVGFRLAADDGREMKDGGGVRVDGALQQRSVADVASDLRDPRVGQPFGGDDVGEGDLVDRAIVTVPRRRGGHAARQPGREGLAEEAGPAGD